MNILYISCLCGNKAAGLTYSVPAQIESQSKIDDVFWYNLNPKYKVNEHVKTNYYSVLDYPIKQISQLPSPYDKPDLVIFQGVYFFDYYKISRQLSKSNIPYMIIPRGSLTSGAQSIKPLKKKLGNMLFFNKFIRHARAIQYLNKAEYEDSGDKWNDTHVIIPNGTHAKQIHSSVGEQNIIKGVFIGRLHVFHKGIDLLIEACSMLKNELDGNLQIDIYGQDQNGSKSEIADLIEKHNLQSIIQVKEAVFDREKEAVLLNSDLFILTSRFEGHPMGLIEALSYGLPCLVTSGTNMAEEIRRENAGWVAENESKSIAYSIRRLINEKSSLLEKGQYAINVSRHYSWDVLAQKSHQMYNDLVRDNVVEISTVNS